MVKIIPLELSEEKYYTIYTGRMGKVFCDWHDKKIDGTKAVQQLKEWYNKGLKKIKNKNGKDFQKEELKRCFDSLAAFIRDNELIDEGNISGNYEIQQLSKKFESLTPLIYETIEKILDKQNQEPKQHFQSKLIKEMIEETILSKDGKTPYKSLNDIAIFIVKNNKPLSMKLLLDLGLRKKDGDPYGDSAYQKAIHYANTYNPKLENGKKMHK